MSTRYWTSDGSPTSQLIDLRHDSCIGVVAIETFAETHEWKAYIGLGAGVNPRTDEQQIARHGSGLLPEQAQGFFPRLDVTKYKQY